MSRMRVCCWSVTAARRYFKAGLTRLQSGALLWRAGASERSARAFTWHTYGGSSLSRQGAVGQRERYSFAFVVAVALFVTTLITANVTAVKLVGFFGLVLPAAVVVFPVSYICGDVLTEVYGYRVARRVIWLGFLCNLLAIAAIYLGGIPPRRSVLAGPGGLRDHPWLHATPLGCLLPSLPRRRVR